MSHWERHWERGWGRRHLCRRVMECRRPYQPMHDSILLARVAGRDAGAPSGAPNGFTLIEMLIVIAIVAIMSAMTMAYLTAPALEQPFASAELDFEYGSAMFFSQIVNDAHRAVRLSFWPAPQPALIFELQGGNGARVGARISYFVDQSKRLWRTTGSLEEAEQALASEFAPGAAGGPRKNTGGRIGSLLMENVEELSAKQNAATGRWRIVLRAAFERYERRISLDRHADIALGKAWAGAKP